jgi:hypothetical protein
MRERNSSIVSATFVTGALLVSSAAAQAFQTEPAATPAPSAPEQLRDYANLIGTSGCRSARASSDGSFPDTVAMSWRFKYILGGFAVQDESWKDDGTYASSIRQYDADSARWAVTYFASTSAPAAPPTWTGGNVGGDIVLSRPQPSPFGAPGASRLTFYNISSAAFDWKGEWVSGDGSIVFPFWRISCTKAADEGSPFSWLEGAWRNESNGSIESWQSLSGDVLRGETHIEDQESGERRVVEEVLLYRSGERWFYVPDVSHNALPVPFVLRESEGRSFVFENLNHDYPKRIVYEAAGEAALVVRISDVGSDGSSVRVGEFRFRR